MPGANKARLLVNLAARLSRRNARVERTTTNAVIWYGRPDTQQWRGYAASTQPSNDVLVGRGSGNNDGDAPAAVAREPETPLVRSIRNRIVIRGSPLTLAEYMSEVLTNPLTGYYTSAGGEAGAAAGPTTAAAAKGGPGSSSSPPPLADNDGGGLALQPPAAAAGRSVFGARGDFVTSPEISQLFGEVSAFFAS
jgi:hypothetical protein